LKLLFRQAPAWSFGARRKTEKGLTMENSEFPLEKTTQETPGLSTRMEPRPTLYRSVELPEPAAEGYNNLSDYWQLLARYRMILLSFAICGVLVAIIVSLIQTPIYRVRTSLEIQSPNLLDLRGTDSNGAAGNFTTPETYVETQVKLLQSDSLLDHVIDKLNLQKDSPLTKWQVLTSRVRRMFDRSESSPLTDREDLIKKIQRNLTVRTSGNSQLLEVLYESPDPQLAADFANTLVSDFIEISQEERWKAAQGTSEWLTSHLDEMKVQLEASEARLQDYALTSGLSPTSDKESPVESQLKELADELSQAQADRIGKQAKYEEARSKPVDSLPEMLEDSTMRDDRAKMTELQRQYAELSATLTPEHYKVQRVQAQIDELKSSMQKERDNVLQRIGDEYAAAVRRERLLSEAHANQEKVVANQSSKAIHYDTLKRDVDSNRHLYELMLQRVKEASLASAMRDSNVLVVDRARRPLLPYRPNLPTNSAIGLLGGTFLGFAFVLIRERVDRRISAPGDAKNCLDLPVLGVIPLDEFALPMPVLNRLSLHRSTPSLTAKTVARSSGEDCPELATWKRKPSLLAECARTTLTSILLPTQEGMTPQLIVFTSPEPGDGKTTVACNLSIAMAEIGRMVLLIEGDLRRPRLHKVFGVPNDTGLGDLLWMDMPLESVPISSLVRETGVPGLCLLPGGGCSGTPANLFYSPRMARLLSRVRKEFDTVMIDAPPMIHLADARVLGRLSDGVILVVRAGHTTADGALFASQRFAEDGTRVLGTVLNSWNPRSSDRYGYAYGHHADYTEHAAK
jgi:polysaccharide biosynthesis transport protein